MFALWKLAVGIAVFMYVVLGSLSLLSLFHTPVKVTEGVHLDTISLAI